MRFRSALVGLLSLLSVLPLAATTYAHNVVVDGEASDWLARMPASANLGIIARDATSAGEFVWSDASGDQRTDLGSGGDIDITEFRVTGSTTGLSFLVQFAAAPSGTTPQIQIAIDTNRYAGMGQTFFAGFGDTSVGSNAAWEFLVQTQMGSSVRVLDTTFANTGTGTIARAGNTVEISVPWTALGTAMPPLTALRFTVATFYEQPSGDTMDVDGASISNALDAVTNYGAPQPAGPYPNTWQDVMDGRVDYSFDAYFGMMGEVYAPVIIQQVLAAPGTPGPGQWWDLVVVTNGITFDLGGYATGNASRPGSSGYMGVLPSTCCIRRIATDAAAFRAFYGYSPDFETGGTSPSVYDLPPQTAWSSGTSLTLDPAGDTLVVIDPSFTLIDIVTFGNASYPGIGAMPAPPTRTLVGRRMGWPDTDDNAQDFAIGPTICGPDVACGTCFDCAGGGYCRAATAGTACDDATVCNGRETCDGSGTCVSGTSLDCDDANACSTDTCDASAGCLHTSVPVGTSCDDTTVCNGHETCGLAGTCTSGTALDCDDDNPCTADACDASGGCMHTNVAAGVSCADADPCNGAESCDGSGACAAGAPLDCTDANACTVDACVVGTGCSHLPALVGTSCSDGDVCNGVEVCNAAGMCLAGTPLACGDGNPCTVDVCDATAGCTNAAAPSGAACDDGDPCNGVETCNASAMCISSGAPSCDDNNPCTADSCGPGGCMHAPVATGTSCSDGNACNGAETCNATGMCVGGAALSCDDANPCTADTCDASAGCQHANAIAGTACGDGDPCNGAEACDGTGACAAGTALTCDDGNPCTVDACTAGVGCTTTPVIAGTTCSDGDMCNGVETCDAAGACRSGTALSCSDGNPCTIDTCDAATGCHHANAPSGSDCGDGNACNGAETCDASGACVAGAPVTCAPTGNPCTTNACNPLTGSCESGNAAAGTNCDDGDLCNGLETCNGSGACVMGVPSVDAGLCADAGPDAMADAEVDGAADADDVAMDAIVDAGADVRDAADSAVDVSAPDASRDDGADEGADVAVGDVAATDATPDAVADARSDAGADVVAVSDASHESSPYLAGGGCTCSTMHRRRPATREALAIAALALVTLAVRRRRRAA
jgi:hypothetical protein